MSCGSVRVGAIKHSLNLPTTAASLSPQPQHQNDQNMHSLPTIAEKVREELQKRETNSNDVPIRLCRLCCLSIPLSLNHPTPHTEIETEKQGVETM
jgi:hypothetical protein